MIFDFLFNINEGIVVFLVGLIIGVVLLLMASQAPSTFGIRNFFRLGGFLSILGTLAYWVLLSVGENLIEIIMKNIEIALIIFFVIVIGVIIFKEEIFSKKKNKKR